MNHQEWQAEMQDLQDTMGKRSIRLNRLMTFMIVFNVILLFAALFAILLRFVS
jgi:hypothetical protein